MTALGAAYEDLMARRNVADAAGDWREYAVLDGLASVADYVRRVGDVVDSAHYRADKGGELLDAAVRLQGPLFAAYAGWPDDDGWDRITHDGVKAAGEVAVAVRRVLWELAGAELYGEAPEAAEVAAGVREAAAGLTAWAARVSAGRGEW